MRYLKSTRFCAPPKWELRAILGVMLLAVIVGSVSSSQKARTVPLGPAYSAKVVHIADGDTISVVNNGQVVTIRLRRVDCPESVQKFGPQAKAATVAWCAQNPTVTVTPYDVDIYGRSIAEVTSPSGTSLEEALVTSGLAWWYKEYDPIDAQLSQEEAEARSAKRGLWLDTNPLAPWEFRKLQKAGYRFHHAEVPDKPPLHISPIIGTVSSR